MSHSSWTSARIGALLVFAAAAACSSGGAIEASSATGASTPNNTPAGAMPSAGNTSAAGAANPGAASSPGSANPASSSGTVGTPTPLTTMESPPQPAQLAPGNGSPPGTETGAPPAAPATSAETCNLAGAAGAATPTIWVIGDSTASVYAANLYPRMGWAQPLQDLFAPGCATVADRAISGRSSKSFFDEGAWAPVRDALKSGDFVLIQFGHNDEKSEDPLRFTDPFTTFQQYLSTYINDSLAHGGRPYMLASLGQCFIATRLIDRLPLSPERQRFQPDADAVTLSRTMCAARSDGVPGPRLK